MTRWLWLIIAAVIGTALGRGLVSLLSRLLGGVARFFRRGPPVPPNPTSWHRGEIYSVRTSPVSFGAVKVLAADAEAVHLRISKQKFPTRPTHLDSSVLTTGTVQDTDGFGMGHVPIAHETFRSWEPVLLGREHVAEYELEGYHIWLESQGGVFR